MSKRYLITLTAANRVGILAAVTTALDELGANLVEGSQTVIQKFFTLILAADFPADRHPDVIVDHIRDIGRPYRIDVSLKDPHQETLHEDCPSGCRTCCLSLTGQDQPGVLRLISTIFAQHEIDVADLHAAGRDDGSFLIALRLTVPPDVEVEALTAELERKGQSIALSATVEQETVFSVPVLPRPPLRFVAPAEQ